MLHTVWTYIEHLSSLLWLDPWPLCRDWTREERNKWEQIDRQEQFELADHANAATTPQEQSLPGTALTVLARHPISVRLHHCKQASAQTS